MGILSGVLAVITIAYFVPRLPPSIISAIMPKSVAATATGTSPNRPSNATPSRAALARPADQLKIPALGINAPIITLGLAKDGSLDTPGTLWQAGWYKGSARPGAAGAAIIDGHSGAPGQIGVFEHLNRLRPGATFSYTYVDGRT